MGYWWCRCGLVLLMSLFSTIGVHSTLQRILPFSFKKDRAFKAFCFCCLVNCVQSTHMKASSSSSSMNSVNNDCTTSSMCLRVSAFDGVGSNTKPAKQSSRQRHSLLLCCMLSTSLSMSLLPEVFWNGLMLIDFACDDTWGKLTSESAVPCFF